MPQLSAYGLDAMVSDIAWNATFDIYRNSPTPTTAGGFTNSWAVVDSGVGRIRELHEMERLANEERKDKLTHRIYTPPTLDIQRGDVAVVTNAPPGGVTTFLVLHAHAPDNVAHHYEIGAKSFVVGDNETPKGFAISGVNIPWVE